MKYCLFSVRDVHNGFGLPLCDYNERTAKRAFLAAASQEDVISPADYDLFCIGEFDTESGIISPLAYPAIVCRGVEAVSVRSAALDSSLEASVDG